MFCFVRVTDRSRRQGQRTFHHDVVVEFVPAFDLWLVVSFYHLCGTY